MPGHAKKATKKFEKNHLKDTIGRRKEFAKIKQRHQVKEKKKARRVKENGAALDGEGDGEPEGAKEQEKQTLQDMTMDEFFQGGLDILESKKKKRRKNQGKEDTHIKDSEPSAGISKSSKRKRTEDDDDDSQEEATSTRDTESKDEQGETSLHKGDLDALAEKDPEFYKYLKENDAELLDFEEEDLERLELSDADEEPAKKKPKKSKAAEASKQNNDSSEVTLSRVKKWKTAMDTQHSLRATREVVLAFRAAAHANDEDGSSQSYKYAIPTPEAYHELLLTALTFVPKVLVHHLPPTPAKGNKPAQVPTSSKKFRTLSPLLKSHTQSLIGLLSSLSDDPTITLTLTSTLPLLPYVLSFKKLLKSLTKSVLTIWSSPATSSTSSSSSSEKTRLTAFLLLRTLAIAADPSLLTALLKSTYQALITTARTTNPTTLSTINLLKNSAATLWTLDPSVGYATAFTSIRQLAILLRAALTQPSKDTHAKVYNWQFTHCLDFWSRVLASTCSSTDPTLKKPADSPFHPLIYPLVQISLGALNLLPTPTYFPLHFHLVRALLRISRQTSTYIPLFPPLLAILRSPTCAASSKASTLRPLDFRAVVRAPGAYLKTRVYQTGVGEEVVELLGEFFGVWAKSIAFPELCIPPVGMLKRWLKDVSASGDAKGGGGGGGGGGAKAATKGKKDGRGNRNQRLSSQLVLLVQKLNANASFVEEKRRKVRFAPSDREEVERFLREVAWEDMPLGAYLAARRVEREEKERVVDEARREEKEAKGGKAGREGDVEVEDDVGQDGSADEDEEEDED